MSTTPQKIKFDSSDGKSKITAYIWDTEASPVRGVLQIIHGMREHMGRYADFASFLNAKGYVVCGNDHIGHGESSSGGYGYFGNRDGAKHILFDCKRMTEIIKKKYPDTPIFLMGHSMGSYIGRVYITRYSRELEGFICMGTGDGKRLAPLARTMAWGFEKLGWGEKPGILLDEVAFGKFNRRHPHEQKKMAWLSRDFDIVDSFENDKHTKAKFTNSGFRDLLDLQMAACGKKWAGRVPKGLPVLITSGTEDPVGDYGKGVTRVYRQLKNAGVRNVQLKLYMGARHEILNELNKEEVYFDIYCWIKENNN